MRQSGKHPSILLDMGQVLSGPQNPKVFEDLVGELGISITTFMKAWAIRRRDLDAGIIDASRYWFGTLADCGVPNASQIAMERLAELRELDLQAWMSPRPSVHELLDSLLDKGVELAILSNMPPGVGERFVESWPLVARIPAHLRFFSGDEGFAKPDPKFFLHFLDRSGWSAPETLFIDDIKQNVDAASELGFAIHHFTDEEVALRAISDWIVRS